MNRFDEALRRMPVLLNGGFFLLWGIVSLISNRVAAEIRFCTWVRFVFAANILLMLVAGLRKQSKPVWWHLLFAMLTGLLWFGCACLHDYARGFTGH